MQQLYNSFAKTVLEYFPLFLIFHFSFHSLMLSLFNFSSHSSTPPLGFLSHHLSAVQGPQILDPKLPWLEVWLCLFSRPQCPLGFLHPLSLSSSTPSSSSASSSSPMASTPPSSPTPSTRLSSRPSTFSPPWSSPLRSLTMTPS